MLTLSQKLSRILNFRGVVAPPVTPFGKAGEVNTAAIPPYLSHLNRIGVDGFFLNGTTAEFYSLTFAERVKLLEKWIVEIRKNSPNKLVIANVTATALKESLEHAKLSEQLGADAISVQAPLYYKTADVGQLTQYLQYVSSAAPQTPLVYYYIPKFVGGEMDIVHLMTEALKKVPNLAGIKYTDSNIVNVSNLQMRHKKSLKLFGGTEQALLTALAGAEVDACICATNSLEAVVTAYKEMLAAYDKSDMEAARAAHERLLNLNKPKGHFLVSLKQALNEECKEVDFGRCRPPIDY